MMSNKQLLELLHSVRQITEFHSWLGYIYLLVHNDAFMQAMVDAGMTKDAGTLSTWRSGSPVTSLRQHLFYRTGTSIESHLIDLRRQAKYAPNKSLEVSLSEGSKMLYGIKDEKASLLFTYAHDAILNKAEWLDINKAPELAVQPDTAVECAKPSSDLLYCKTLDGKVWVVWSTDQPGTAFKVYPIEYLGNAQEIQTIESVDCVLVSTDLEAVKSATSNLMRIEVIVCPTCNLKAEPNAHSSANKSDLWFSPSDLSFARYSSDDECEKISPIGCPSCGTVFLPVPSTKQFVNSL